MDKMIEDGEATSDAEIARLAGIGKSTLSEALKKGAVQTAVMPEIHKALGWPPPLMTPPIHVLELVQFFERLGALDQGRWLERLRSEVASAKSRPR